ncbi:hypothetical protein H8P37_005061, partial [Salmonella enterica]|nr:hypothetical protein [Salmonella enterica]
FTKPGGFFRFFVFHPEQELQKPPGRSQPLFHNMQRTTHLLMTIYIVLNPFSVMCLAGGLKRLLRLFPERGTLPESCEYAENRITKKSPSGNLMVWLYD